MIGPDKIDCSFAAVKITSTNSRFHFAAAAVTLGFELSEHSPGIDNVYSEENPLDRKDPHAGDVKIYFEPIAKNGLQLKALVTTWADPASPLNDAPSLPGRIKALSKLSHDEKTALGRDIENLSIGCSVANMKLFSLGRFSIQDINQTAQELEAIQFLHDLPSKLIEGNGRKLAAELESKWTLAMMGWIKAWIANFMEIRTTWKFVPPAILIDRKEITPLVIPFTNSDFFEQTCKRFKHRL